MAIVCKILVIQSLAVAPSTIGEIGSALDEHGLQFAHSTIGAAIKSLVGSGLCRSAGYRSPHVIIYELTALGMNEAEGDRIAAVAMLRLRAMKARPAGLDQSRKVRCGRCGSDQWLTKTGRMSTHRTADGLTCRGRPVSVGIQGRSATADDVAVARAALAAASDGKRVTLAAIGKALGVSGERVRQILASAKC